MLPAFTAHSNTASEGAWQSGNMAGNLQKVYLTTKLGWRHENEATHHKPAGLVWTSPWCAVCLHMYRASTVAVKHGTAGSTHWHLTADPAASTSSTSVSRWRVHFGRIAFQNCWEEVKEATCLSDTKNSVLQVWGVEWARVFGVLVLQVFKCVWKQLFDHWGQSLSATWKSKTGSRVWTLPYTVWLDRHTDLIALRLCCTGALSNHVSIIVSNVKTLLSQCTRAQWEMCEGVRWEMELVSTNSLQEAGEERKRRREQDNMNRRGECGNRNTHYLTNQAG